MTRSGPLRTATIVGDPSSKRVRSLVEQLRQSDWMVREESPSWMLVLRPGRRWAGQLVVVDISGARAGRALKVAAVIARWYRVPLLVLDDSRGSLTREQESRLSRLLTSDVITRVLRPVDEDAGSEAPGGVEFDHALLQQIGLGPGDPAIDGVRALTVESLPDVVEIHREAFPESAMTLLGKRVVDRYYRWQFIGPHPLPFAAGVWREGTLQGFVFGGVRRGAVSGFARRFLSTVIVGALTHPAGAKKLIGPKVVPVLRFMVRRTPQTSSPAVVEPARATSPVAPASAPSLGVLSIAVARRARGTGAATELLVAAEQEARRSGFSQMHLTVDTTNARALRFYEREGWVRKESDGLWRGGMIKSLRQ